jgi:hypothetical protein
MSYRRPTNTTRESWGLSWQADRTGNEWRVHAGTIFDSFNLDRERWEGEACLGVYLPGEGVGSGRGRHRGGGATGGYLPRIGWRAPGFWMPETSRVLDERSRIWREVWRF